MVLTQYLQMYLQRPHPTFKWDTPCNCWALWDRAMPVWLAHNPRQVPRGLYLRRGMCIVLTEAQVHWQVCTSVWLVALANSIDPLFLRFNGFPKYQTWSDDIPVAIEIKPSWMQILLGFCFYQSIQQFYTEGIRKVFHKIKTQKQKLAREYHVICRHEQGSGLRGSLKRKLGTSAKIPKCPSWRLRVFPPFKISNDCN